MNTIRKILSIFTARQRRTVLWIIALGFVGMFLEVLAAGLVVPVLALPEQGGDFVSRYPELAPWLSRLGNPSTEQLIVFGVSVLVTVFIVKNLFLVYYYWQEARFVFGFQAELSQRMFTIYLRQPYTFHLRRNSALLLRNTINEVVNFSHQAVGQGTVIVTEGLVLIGMASLLLFVEPVGATVVLVILGGASLCFHLSTRGPLHRWGKARQHHEGLRIKHLQEGLGSIKDVKLLGRERDFLEQYDVHNIQSTLSGQYNQTLKQLPRLWLETLFVVCTGTLVYSLLLRDQPLESVVPTLGLFAAAAFRLLPTANRLLSAVQSIRYGLPVIHILHEELALSVPPPRRGDSGPSSVFQRQINIKDVEYRYADASRPALNKVTLSIAKGETVGLIGPSGSGKSTLVDVILGLLPHELGEISVDGMDIRQIMRDWQDQIGYVPQSIYLTDDTLRRNVAFGVPEDRIDDDAVRRALRAARLDDFVAAQPEGLDLVVGERGVRLSGGQRQRVGIARALYHDPAVLVLDEATSSLDTTTEREFMQAVMDMHGTKTILIVAHRLSTVEQCDRIYRFEEGRLVEEGAPGEMLSYAPSTHGTD